MRKAQSSKGAKKQGKVVVKAKARGKSKPPVRAKKPKAPQAAALSGADLRHQFVALAMRLGPDEAQRLLDAVIEVQTPLLTVKR
jgi:hypothetical protein